MRILIANLYPRVNRQSILDTLLGAGHRVLEKVYFPPASCLHDERLEEALRGDLGGGFDCVFSINYSPVIGKIAQEKGVPYLSWTYDAPIGREIFQAEKFKDNYIFIFDRDEAGKMKTAGFPNVFHLPLASDCRVPARYFRPSGKSVSIEGKEPGFFKEGKAPASFKEGKAPDPFKEGKAPDCSYDSFGDYSCDSAGAGFCDGGSDDEFPDANVLIPEIYDVSLLGGLYRSNLPFLMGHLSDYNKGYLDGIVKSQQAIYGGWLAESALPDDIMESICGEFANTLFKGKGSSYVIEDIRAQLSFAIAKHVTWLDRVTLLRLCSSRWKTALVPRSLSDEERSLIPGVEILPPKSYDEEMPVFFRQSKINLNPPLRIVWSAIQQRALDIMCCGGFLLSGYTAELAENFEDGKELALYSSMEEAVEKAAYYLAHDEERRAIALKGMKKTRALYRYEDRFAEMFCVAGLLART